MRFKLDATSMPYAVLDNPNIATLIDMEHFNKNNFKIIELSPAEVLTEVD